MNNPIRKLIEQHLASPGIVVETGQSVPTVEQKSFGRASDIAGVVPPIRQAATAGSSGPAGDG